MLQPAKTGQATEVESQEREWPIQAFSSGSGINSSTRTVLSFSQKLCHVGKSHVGPAVKSSTTDEPGAT